MINDLDTAIAELRERKPEPPPSKPLEPPYWCRDSAGGEWDMELDLNDNFVSWQPRHAYSTDIAAAMRLFRELPSPDLFLRDGCCDVVASFWTAIAGERRQRFYEKSGHEARAIARAWYKWKTGTDWPTAAVEAERKGE